MEYKEEAREAFLRKVYRMDFLPEEMFRDLGVKKSNPIAQKVLGQYFLGLITYTELVNSIVDLGGE